MTAEKISSSSLIITLFGPMQALVDGHPLPRMRSRKGLWLLALLTLRHDRSVGREWLAGTLWPDVDQDMAFANLRPILSELRNSLGSQKERLQSPDRHTLLLNLAGAQVDVVAFDNAIASGKLSEMEAAAALYRGHLLEGCTEEWVFQERSMREQSCLQALQKLGDGALRAGEYLAATGYFQRAISIDPWQESARRGWMEALAKNGDRNAALQVYREFVTLLKDDPKAVPDEQTTALYVRLRAEIRQPEHAQAVVVNPPVSVPKVSGYLPHSLTDMVGREDECLEVAARLRRFRLVTLTGMGGIGKTRLALEVSREVVREYADGVWLVALESLTDKGQILPQIASVFGIKEDPARRLQDTIDQFLRTKHLLIVIDNCEHLLEASAQVIGHLLQKCGQLKILATSRELLEITGEAVWSVPALAAPDPVHLPQGNATLLRVLMSYESAQLFVERAQAVQKTFSLTGSNARAVAQICFRLEGIPLAIELAAARIKAMTVEQIAVRLHDNLGLLTGGSRAGLTRQQTLRAALNWSYDLLSDPERLLLCRLSVFTGGWNLEAAEAVCADADMESVQILDLLTFLVDKSLVAYAEREGNGRYRLLEMVRQYAAEKLEASGETASFKNQHLAWFVTLAEESESQMKGAEQSEWLRRLETEYDNLRAALAWSERAAHDNEAGLRLTGALWWFWKVRGRFSEGRQFLKTALEGEGAHRETEARAKALNGAGALAFNQSDYTAAHVLLEESLAIYRKHGNRTGMASALNNLGSVASQRNDYAAGIALKEESLAISREAGDPSGIATALLSLSTDVRQLGDYAKARLLLEESLTIRRRLKDEHGTALALSNLGNVIRLQGDYEKAQEYLEESLVIRRTLKDREGIAYTLSHLGALIYTLGDFSTAQSCFEESLTLRREIGNRLGTAWSLNNLGLVALHGGRAAEARTLFEESHSVFRELEVRGGMAWTLNHLGDVACQSDDYKTAQNRFLESLTIFHELKDREGVAENLRDLAAVLAVQTSHEKAARLWGAAEALRETIGAPVPLIDREDYDRQVEQTRTVLGENAFTIAWDAGRALTWEEAADDLMKALTQV